MKKQDGVTTFCSVYWWLLTRFLYSRGLIKLGTSNISFSWPTLSSVRSPRD